MLNTSCDYLVCTNRLVISEVKKKKFFKDLLRFALRLILQILDICHWRDINIRLQTSKYSNQVWLPPFKCRFVQVETIAKTIIEVNYRDVEVKPAVITQSHHKWDWACGLWVTSEGCVIDGCQQLWLGNISLIISLK